LQDRDDNFYSRYLEELESEKYATGDLITKEGSDPTNVFFIMNGVVHNQTTNRYFERGQMLNQNEVMTFSPCPHDCVAYTDVSVLKYDKNTFNLILDQF